MSDTSNLAFTKILDTVYDSKVLDGLAANGVLPKTFQCYVSTIDVSSQAVGTVVGQLIDQNGKAIVLAEGQQVVYARAGVTEAIATAANLTLDIGLAPDETTAGVGTIIADTTGTVLNAAGGVYAPSVAGGVVGTTNKYVNYQSVVATAALTGGIVKVFLIVV